MVRFTLAMFVSLFVLSLTSKADDDDVTVYFDAATHICDIDCTNNNRSYTVELLPYQYSGVWYWKIQVDRKLAVYPYTQYSSLVWDSRLVGPFTGSQLQQITVDTGEGDDWIGMQNAIRTYYPNLKGESHGGGYAVIAASGGGFDLIKGSADSSSHLMTEGRGTVVGSSQEYAIGGDETDYLEGGDNDEHLWGYGGNDVLDAYGSTGMDYLEGMNGNDVLLQGSGQSTTLCGNNFDAVQNGTGADYVYAVDCIADFLLCDDNVPGAYIGEVIYYDKVDANPAISDDVYYDTGLFGDWLYPSCECAGC